MKTGVVKYFSMDSKYGFIINNEDSKDVFVHRSNIKELIKGDKVRFELKTKDCKNYASNIELIN
jgi:cold shock CspA family protein